MSVDNTDDELVVTGAPIDTVKPSFQLVSATASASEISPGATVTLVVTRALVLIFSKSSSY